MNYLILLFLIVALSLGVFFLIKKAIQFRWSQRLKSRVFKDLFKKSILEVVDVCEEVGVTYWFTEGTLIGLLRYGANEHESREMLIDDDIDLMIEAKNHEDWLLIKKKLIQGLEKRGWGGLYERTTSSSKKGRIDKMQMWMYKSGNIKTHVDFHSYFTNNSFAYSHMEKNSYPFQYWNGELPREMIYPMRSCICYGVEVPCPNKPIEILKGWNGGEYEDTNIAFPIGQISEKEKKAIIEKSRELDRMGYASMIHEIEKL